MVEITGVTANSPAQRAGLAAGDFLCSVGGHEIVDVLDYQFYMTQKNPELVYRRGEKEHRLRLRKGEYEDAGLLFATFLMDTHHSCKNKCIFCFIDQLPRGMRKTLYFKDDDSRLSFLQGNYITLTNLSERDVDRIIEMHMSPVRVSVHTTDPVLRVKMMKNPHAGEVLSYLGRFAKAGIALDCQIVLCRDYNDGAALLKTMRDLLSYLPALRSVSVVPAGLTKHRQGLCPLRPFDRESAEQAVHAVEAVAQECFEKYGTHIFYCSDELYLCAGLPLPPASYYEGFEQLENGVGTMTNMEAEIDDELPYLAQDFPLAQLHHHRTVATGTLAAPFLQAQAKKLAALAPGVRVDVVGIKNDFFGHTVTVAGLVTGGDLVAQLRGRDLGECVLIPRCMLQHDADVFLDDMTLTQAQQALGVPIYTSDGSGADFLHALLKTDFTE